MIRRPENNELTINIDGEDGNAFVLMRYASQIARELRLDRNSIIEEMKSGDYIHLLKTFMKYFPMIVLETNNEDLLKELS